jgi:hypothetical protein
MSHLGGNFGLGLLAVHKISIVAAHRTTPAITIDGSTRARYIHMRREHFVASK